MTPDEQQDERLRSLAELSSLALSRLSVREYASAEMESYLRRKGASAPDAAAIVSELVRMNAIDDERYARVIARHQAMRDKGPAYVEAKLRQKGVRLPRQRLLEIFREVLPEERPSEKESVRRILERRYPEAGRDAKAKSRAFQALLRRGFSRSAILECLKEFSENNGFEAET